MTETELERLARAATPGPWEAEPMVGQGAWIKNGEGRWCALSCGEDNGEGKRNAAYIAAASPDRVLALISRIRELEEGFEPEALEAIADEIDCFEHSARAAGLRGIARRARALLPESTS